MLQPGEGISGSHSLPIGQVLFVPREEITLRDCGEEELAAIRRSREEFSREKAALTRTTAYGLAVQPSLFPHQPFTAARPPARARTRRPPPPESPHDPMPASPPGPLALSGMAAAPAPPRLPARRIGR